MLELQEDGSLVESDGSMRWRQTRPAPAGEKLARAAADPVDEQQNPPPLPAVPPPEPGRPRRYSRSPFGAVFLPGEMPGG